MKKVTFGIIGYGHIGSRYQQKLSENPNTSLVAVADTKPERLRAVGSDVKLFNDYNDLLKDQSVDVVVVSVPNHLHKKIAIDVLKSGKHVICEKPMTLTVFDANQMILESQQSKGHLFVVKQNRFNPPVKKIKEFLDKQQLGEIGFVVVNCFWNRNEDYYSSSDWKGKKDLDGGTLFTQFSHFIDIVYYLFGDFKSVYAIGRNFTHQTMIEFEDTGAVAFQLASGAIGAFNYTTSSFQQNMEGSISIFGSKGTVKIGGQYLNTLDYYLIDGVDEIELEKGNTANDYGTYKGSMSNHDKIIENVVETIRGNQKVATSGFEGMQVVKIIQSIYESMQTGERVNVQ